MGWPIDNARKLALIRQVVAGEPAAAPARPAAVKKAVAKPKAKPAAKAKAKPAPKPAAVSTKRLMSEGQARRIALWNELKKIAPDKANNLSYGDLNTDKLAAIVADIKSK